VAAHLCKNATNRGYDTKRHEEAERFFYRLGLFIGGIRAKPERRLSRDCAAGDDFRLAILFP
jgi:hypothetical protein